MDTEQRSRMLGNMDVRKLLVKLSIPAIIAMMANAIYNLVDTIFIGRAVDTIAIGALSIAFPVQMIVLAIGIMIGIGSASVFSRAYGRGDNETMVRTVNTALFMGLVLSVAISLLTYIFLEPLLVFFGATAGNIDYAREYLVFILVALPPFSLSIILNNLTRAEGRPNVAMISLLIGAGLNIVLDPFLIFDFGLGLGVRGAAIATAISKTASFIYVLSRAMTPKSALVIRLKTLYKVDFQVAKEMLAVGAPTFVRNSLGAILVIIVNNLIRHYETANPEIYISIYGVITRMTMFTLLPGFGLVQGLQPIVGFNFGARFYQRLMDVLSFATKLVFGYFFLMSVIVIVFARPLFLLFSPEGATEPALHEIFITEGSRAFRIVAAGFTMISFQVLLSAVYQAMGYALRAFFVALSRQFFLFIPLAFLFTHLTGDVIGVWFAFVASDLLAGGGSLAVHLYEMHILKQKIA